MYSDLDKYKVVPGSVWEFEKGLLVSGSNLDPINQSRIPQVHSCYTDPPWNQGNMKMFYGFAKKQIEKPFNEFIGGILDLLSAKVQGTIFMDMGVKQTTEVLAFAEQRGWRTKAIFTTLYSQPPRPCTTVCGSFSGFAIIPSNLNGLHGVKVIETIVKDLLMDGNTMFDPCCGKLDFLSEGLKQGMDKVYGIELIPEKLALGLERIHKMGYNPRRVN